MFLISQGCGRSELEANHSPPCHVPCSFAHSSPVGARGGTPWTAETVTETPEYGTFHTQGVGSGMGWNLKYVIWKGFPTAASKSRKRIISRGWFWTVRRGSCPEVPFLSESLSQTTEKLQWVWLSQPLWASCYQLEKSLKILIKVWLHLSICSQERHASIAWAELYFS